MGAKGHVFGGGGFVVNGAQRYGLAIIELDAAQPAAHFIATEFLPHGVAFDPRDVCRAAIFEKKGPGACIVDLHRRQVVQPIATLPTRRFYGHGVWSADGALLYTTETCLDRDLAGVLVMRDAQTLVELGTLPTYGAAPHDCRLIHDGQTMVVANGGGHLDAPRSGPACVSYIELSSGKLLQRVKLGSPRINAGHIEVTAAGDLVVVSAPRDGIKDANKQLGAVSLRTRARAMKTVSEPKAVVGRMLGETLSVVINEATRVALTTHPLGDCVSMWRLDNATCLGTLELKEPRGVAMTLDRQWYLVSHRESGSVRLTAFCAKSGQPVGFFVDPSFMSGSHIFVRDVGL